MRACMRASHLHWSSSSSRATCHICAATLGYLDVPAWPTVRMFPYQHHWTSACYMRRAERVCKKVAERRCDRKGERGGQGSGRSALGFGSCSLLTSVVYRKDHQPLPPPRPSNPGCHRPSQGGRHSSPTVHRHCEWIVSLAEKIVHRCGRRRRRRLVCRPRPARQVRRIRAAAATLYNSQAGVHMPCIQGGSAHLVVPRPRARADRLGKSSSSPAMVRCKPYRKSVRTAAQAAPNSRIQTPRSR